MTKYIITDHAMERYAERINYNQKKTRDAIMKDLKALKNKRIINIGDKKHIFYKNYREFILQKKGNIEILVTVIKHKRSTKQQAIEKREQERQEYLDIINEFKVDKDK
ncbi:hypothetical protein CF1_0136 [Staphylococcus phage CF1]|uniref:Type II toxin-antitoxin system RelE/ParE family toxin n=1 Tax=Staphylococcus phage CF9 TaxID=3113741 RepID=A0AAX4J776_9CAUD|nr:hypothetical protein CF1_0136 [Staphylococcus phage CF1]WRW34541.1 hypothetical protein CF9_0145 [Staphylococcus phage CF9]